MHDLTIKYVDAFTTNTFSGNPAAVITDAAGLTIEEMQSIAKEINISESTYVTKPESKNAMFRIRFFTQSNQLDLSGHAVIATCYALIEEGRVRLDDGKTTVMIETNLGDVPLDIYFSKDTYQGNADSTTGNRDGKILNGVNKGRLDRIMIHQDAGTHEKSRISIEEISDILDIDPMEIKMTGLPMEFVSNGQHQFMIPVGHRETLLNLKPDLIRLSLMNARYGIETNDIFTLDSISEECISYSRHFAPAIGLWEDQGSGNAAATIGTYLTRHGITSTRNMIMEQGKDVHKLARIFVEIDYADGSFNSVKMGGLATTSISRKINVSEGKVVII